MTCRCDWKTIASCKCIFWCGYTPVSGHPARCSPGDRLASTGLPARKRLKFLTHGGSLPLHALMSGSELVKELYTRKNASGILPLDVDASKLQRFSLHSICHS